MSVAVRLHRPMALCGLAAIAVAAEANGAEPPQSSGVVEVRFTDDSALRLTLKDANVEVTTPYGKLSIPICEIQRIDFATRLAGDTAKRIDEAVADLGHPLFPKREAASAELLKLR